jgi:thioredoxin reductase (NADPH)
MVQRDVVIVGAGPSGLAAAIACQRRRLDFEVIEKGVLVNSIQHFPAHMVFFTTPELMEIGGFPFVSPYEKPTRLETLRYYRRVVETLRLPLTLGEAVEVIERQADGTLVVRASRPPSLSPTGLESFGAPSPARRAKAVVLAIGYYDHPNRIGVPGEDLPHVSHYYSEAHPFFRKRVVVVGGRNSAAETALELYRSGAEVTLVHRGAGLSESIKYWVLPDIRNRIAEGSIAARLETRVTEITPEAVLVDRNGVREAIPADAVFLLTGYHPDQEFLQRCGVRLEAGTCLPVHDRETLETNVPNVFVAGGVISGHDTAPVFIENGRLHGEKVVGLIAARLGR